MADVNQDLKALQEQVAAKDAEIAALKKEAGEQVAALEAKIESARDGLDPERLVNVRNVTAVNTHFKSLEHPGTDKMVAKKKAALLTVGEILSQVHAGNPDFVGDGNGKHASLYIEDAEVRTAAGFGSSQNLVDEAAIIKLFETDGKKFEAALKKGVVTYGEKQTLKEVIAFGKVNDHGKIKIAEAFLKGE